MLSACAETRPATLSEHIYICLHVFAWVFVDLCKHIFSDIHRQTHMRERGKAAPPHAHTPVRSHLLPKSKINKTRGLRAMLQNTVNNGYCYNLRKSYSHKMFDIFNGNNQ